MRKLEIFDLCQRLAACGIPFSFRNLDGSWILLYLTRDSEIMGYYAQSECDGPEHNFGKMAGRWFVNSLDDFEGVPGDISTAYRLFYDSYRFDQSGTLQITNNSGIVTSKVLRHMRHEISRQLRRRNPEFWFDVINETYRTCDSYEYLDSVYVSLICSSCMDPGPVDYFDHG